MNGRSCEEEESEECKRVSRNAQTSGSQRLRSAEEGAGFIALRAVTLRTF
jgi:hypothetical protein